MHALLSSILVALLVASSAAAQGARNGQADTEREIARLIRERLDASTRGDAIAWSRYVADDCLCATSTKAALQQEMATRLPNLKNGYGDILDLQVHVYTDTAIARYRVSEYYEIAGQRITYQVWRVETYMRRDRVWKLVGGLDSVIPRDPVVAKVDPKVYDAYAGQYEYAPGMVDTVTREGDHLMVQSAGQPKEEMFPESETTYFSKGQDWRLVFVKDEQGRATAVRFRQHGQDIVAKKIK